MAAIAEAAIPTIHTEYPNYQQTVELTPIIHTQDTLNLWVKWMNDPDIRKWMDDNLPTSKEVIDERLYIATHDPKRHYFSIQTEGKQIGFISLRQDQMPQTTGEIGILIGEKEYQGRGLGAQAVETILKYAQNTLRLTSVRAIIKPDNEKSIRLFTGAGFVLTGDVTTQGTPMMQFKKQF